MHRVAAIFDTGERLTTRIHQMIDCEFIFCFFLR